MSKLRTVLAGLIISALFTTQTYAQTAENSTFKSITDFKDVLTTVKIYSYDFTYNGDVFPAVEGSGTLISKDGLIVTNNHVVENLFNMEAYSAFEVCLTINQNEKPVCEYLADLVDRSPELDVAVLKLHPADIRGNQVSDLPFLNYKTAPAPKVTDKVTIIGFPDIGGTTITTTQGTISGFEEDETNALNYIKTDSVISSGNSGGTMINQSGEFIGIPTQVAYSYDSLGYAIDLKSVRKWLDEAVKKEPIAGEYNEIVKEKEILYNDAHASHNLSYPHYPKFELKSDKTWNFDTIEKTSVMLSKADGEKTYSFDLRIQRTPYNDLINSPFYQSILEKFDEDNREYSQKYKRREEKFLNATAQHVSYLDCCGGQTDVYFVPYGYALLEFYFQSYQTEVNEHVAAFKQIQDNFKFLDQPQSTEKINRLEHETLGFTITPSGNFSVMPAENFYLKDEIAQFLLEKNHNNSISFLYSELDDWDKKLEIKERLNNLVENVKYLDQFALLSKYENLLIDGLPAWSVSYSYRDYSKFETRKSTQLYVLDTDEEHTFSFDFDTDEDTYDANLKSFEEIVASLQINRDQSDKGKYYLQKFDYTFSDIQNHRFIQAISDLKDKGVIKGYDDGTFRPEKNISRGETLKIVLASKLFNKTPELDKQDTLDPYAMENFAHLNFADHKDTPEWMVKYIRYAREKGIVSGHADGGFHPNENVTLAEALKILFNTHEIKVWQPAADETNFPWHKPYMDKAFQLDILPPDMFDPNRIITRAEFSYIVSQVLGLTETY